MFKQARLPVLWWLSQSFARQSKEHKSNIQLARWETRRDQGSLEFCTDSGRRCQMKCPHQVLGAAQHVFCRLHFFKSKQLIIQMWSNLTLNYISGMHNTWIGKGLFIGISCVYTFSIVGVYYCQTFIVWWSSKKAMKFCIRSVFLTEFHLYTVLQAPLTLWVSYDFC